jgi:hypothetical protein
MVDVERALGESLTLYKKHPAFVFPHFAELIIDFFIFISMAITIIMAIGVHVADVMLEDPYILAEQITEAGLGLVAVIILTLLFTIFLTSLIKAGAVAGVVGMAHNGFKGERVTLSSGFENAKRHVVTIFLFWIVIWILLGLLFAGAFVPAIFSAIFGFSEIVAVTATLFALLAVFFVVLVLYVGIMFVPQYIVVADVGVVESMKKSIGFVRKNLVAVIIYIAVVIVFSFFLFGFFGILGLLTELFSQTNQFLGIFLNIFMNLLSIAVSLVVAPYFEMVKTRMIME